ncbi:MAG: ATP-binding protein [Clostridium sp.]
MINKLNFIKGIEVTKVIPSNNIFSELGKNTYRLKDLLSELIDNSIAARIERQTLNINIAIYYNLESKPTKLIITDDAKGISQDKLGTALSPAAIQTQNSLNEHGMGMKQAIAGIGRLEYLATKVYGEENARVILELRYGDIETYICNEFKNKCGTEICIVDINPIVTANASNITKYLVPYLGARYRNYLKIDKKILNLKIDLINEDTNYVSNSWNVEQVKPIYFHPLLRVNRPVIINFPIIGDEWEAELTFGYAPANKDELKELGLSKIQTYEPYYVSLSKQGIDIIMHDRVILFHQLAEIGIVGAKHPSLNTIRGEINLKKGFSTAITKNSIIDSKNYQECIKKVIDILTGKEIGPNGEKKDYIEMKTYPDRLPESLVRDRLAAWLTSNTLSPKRNVDIEYNIGGIDGYVDVLADNECWEIKIDQASAYDVYQLFMYMDIGEMQKGYLIAKSFTTGAKIASEHIKKSHEKEIILDIINNYPINHPATLEERQNYYK